MTYVLYGLGAFVALIALVLIIAALRPEDFHIQRSKLIQASPEILFPYINHLGKFQEWNPFNKDPQSKNTFEGPEQGPGAIFRWNGNANVGEGSMAIVDSKPSRLVQVDLEFIRPFPGHNDVEFKLEPQSNGTLVVWSMKGKYAFIPKVVGLFMSMDKMIGKEFDHGLSKLQKITEAK